MCSAFLDLFAIGYKCHNPSTDSFKYKYKHADHPGNVHLLNSAIKAKIYVNIFGNGTFAAASTSVRWSRFASHHPVYVRRTLGIAPGKIYSPKYIKSV